MLHEEHQTAVTGATVGANMYRKSSTISLGSTSTSNFVLHGEAYSADPIRTKGEEQKRSSF